MSVTPTGEVVAQIARLARLELSPEEIGVFTPQLGDILKYVEQLQTVDVTGVESMTHPVELETPLREDRVVATVLDEQGEPKVLISAPETIRGGFKVPPVL
jgi:aspartyl-tRNA(Asn)/glutamyl-tRNA(Gln) amidotransferase subunit C